MASSAKHRQSQVLPNTVRECILFMSGGGGGFTQGRQLDPDSLMADLPFIAAPTGFLWFRLGGHLAPKKRLEMLNNALKISGKAANYTHTHTFSGPSWDTQKLTWHFTYPSGKKPTEKSLESFGIILFTEKTLFSAAFCSFNRWKTIKNRQNLA